MAAKTWDQDFRKAAIQASLRKLGPEYRDDPFRYDGSFCLPVGEKPVPFWTPGKFSLMALVVGFGLLILGVVIITAAEDSAGNMDPILAAVATLCSLSGIATFFIPVKGDKLILRRMLGDRVRSRVDKFDSDHIATSELSPPGPEGQKLSIDGDDHVMIFFDDENRRIMIEGIGARYQIRAQDVYSLTSFDFMNYIGAAITYHIDENTTLEIAVARVSLMTEFIRQAPFLFFARKWIKNPLLEKCERTLKFSDAIDLDEQELELAE